MSRRTGVLRGCKYYLVNVSEAMHYSVTSYRGSFPITLGVLTMRGVACPIRRLTYQGWGFFIENRKEYQSDPPGSMTKFRLLGPLH